MEINIRNLDLVKELLTAVNDEIGGTWDSSDNLLYGVLKKEVYRELRNKLLNIMKKYKESEK